MEIFRLHTYTNISFNIIFSSSSCVVTIVGPAPHVAASSGHKKRFAVVYGRVDLNFGLPFPFPIVYDSLCGFVNMHHGVKLVDHRASVITNTATISTEYREIKTSGFCLRQALAFARLSPVVVDSKFIR